MKCKMTGVLLYCCLVMTTVFADTVDGRDTDKVTLALRSVELAEVMEMLSRTRRINILLSNGVDGKVSVNLYDMELSEAIESIATAAGFAVERRNNSYFIVDRDEVGKYAPAGLTELRTFHVQYIETDVMKTILSKHLSSYGDITSLPERKMLVVNDKPYFLDKISTLLADLDREPKQVLIEAKIFEVTLRDSESFGLDWSKLFTSGDGSGSIGVTGLATRGSPGLFFELANSDVEVLFDALKERGRLRTISTPKLLVVENNEAEAIIGDRIGYRVTTTVDQVTTESIEFLESGVILRVKASVDGRDRISLDIHPEVSTATVSDDGIPSLATTEVTTKMLVNNGQTVFIGGLIKHTADQTREGVPVVGDMPLVGRLFSNRSESVISTETIVLITPYLVDTTKPTMNQGSISRVKSQDRALNALSAKTEALYKPDSNPVAESHYWLDEDW